MKSLFEELGGTYRQEGDYLLPDIEVPECPKVGIWGERRRRYLREYQKALYPTMMLSDTLNAHLEEVERTATEMYDCLISQMAAQEGITERLKETNQMEQVQQINNIRNWAAEAVWKELIYA